MTASTDIEIRPAALPVLAHPLESATQLLSDAGLNADGEAFRHIQQDARRSWSQWLASLVPGPVGDVGEDEDDDLWEDENSWVSPMAGSSQVPVAMDWSALDWGRSGRAA